MCKVRIDLFTQETSVSCWAWLKTSLKEHNIATSIGDKAGHKLEGPADIVEQEPSEEEDSYHPQPPLPTHSTHTAWQSSELVKEAESQGPGQGPHLQSCPNWSGPFTQEVWNRSEHLSDKAKINHQFLPNLNFFSRKTIPKYIVIELLKTTNWKKIF